MKTNALLILFLYISLTAWTQTAQDSITIAGINWETTEIQKGIARKHAQVQSLYNCVQNINFVEVDLKKSKSCTKIIITDPNKITSETAIANNAIAAVNGSYFNVKKGYSVCFLKVDKQVIDTTTAYEFAERVTGAMYERKGKMKLIPWNKSIEKSYKKNKGTVLASGPLMLYKGKECDFSPVNKKFIQTKHPRAAIGITKDNKLILITVDGRFKGQAEGINIPELTHLMKMLGGEYALNLDGGGSTTLWSNDAPENGVLNTPYDNRKFDHNGEREVANIIVIVNK